MAFKRFYWPAIYVFQLLTVLSPVIICNNRFALKWFSHEIFSNFFHTLRNLPICEPPYTMVRKITQKTTWLQVIAL